MSEHTEKCLAAREKERIDLVAYEKRWPRYCRKCGAQGGHTDWEYRGECHGIPVSELVYESCSDCVLQGICPRCGSDDTNFLEDASDGGNMKCNSCGWKEGDPGAPQVDSDCGCYEDALDTVQQN